MNCGNFFAWMINVDIDLLFFKVQVFKNKLQVNSFELYIKIMRAPLDHIYIIILLILFIYTYALDYFNFIRKKLSSS